MNDDMLAASRHVAGLTDEQRAERARLAVKNFRAMQRSLTGFARALTGKKNVRVELDTGTPRTDGDRIFFRPPLGLGAPNRHDRPLCEKRDESSRLLCEACRIREEVMAPIYHEISHIAFDSFAPTLEQHKTSLTERAIEEWGSKYAEQIKARVDSIPSYMKNDYKTLAGLISPFLPMILNALEDARVNASMFRVRPGVKVMMKSHVFGLLSEGVEQPDGSVIRWADQPLNAQIVAGCFVIGAGYEINPEWFHADVIEALADPKLSQLCLDAGAAPRAANVYELSFQVLARLRELGFCKNPDTDPEEEEESNARPDDDGDSGDPDTDPDSNASPDTADNGEAEDSASDSDESEASEVSAEEEGDEAGSSDKEASAEESEAGAGSAGDEEVNPSDEASEADGEAGREVGDSNDGDPGDEGSEASGGAESEGQMDSDEGEVGEGGSDPSADGGDAGAERPDAGDEGLADSAGSSESPEDRGTDGGGDPVSGDPSDTTEGGPTDGPELDSSSTEQSAEAQDGGLSDDSESEAEAKERGVSDRDPVSSGASGSGESQQGNEDAERDADSETSSEGGDGDGSEDESSVTPDPATAGSFDWSSEEEGRIDPESDASGEPAEQHSASESEDPTHSDEEDSEAFDMRADEGQGGVKIDTPDFGNPEDVEGLLKLVENHVDPPKSLQRDLDAANEAIDQAIIQGVYFETPSANLWGVRVHREGNPGLDANGNPADNAWSHKRLVKAGIDGVEAGVICDLDIPESIMGRALLHTRRTFDVNKASTYQPNLKAGRVNSRVLGKRAWSGDERLFGKKRVPGKRDYFVLIGVDVSGSTIGTNLALAKRAAMAQAELCQRAGVKFAVYAHTFNDKHGRPFEHDGDMLLDIYEIKSADEPWDSQRQKRLSTIGPDGGNLDGHTLEFYRKRLDEVEATDKIILYYTDGRMPASNYDEELEILQREIRTCKARGYTLLGVGIRTDSPIRHGLDTVRVDNDENLKDVVVHLEKRLAGAR